VKSKNPIQHEYIIADRAELNTEKLEELRFAEDVKAL
jgi:hypothetical protein